MAAVLHDNEELPALLKDEIADDCVETADLRSVSDRVEGARTMSGRRQLAHIRFEEFSSAGRRSSTSCGRGRCAESNAATMSLTPNSLYSWWARSINFMMKSPARFLIMPISN